MTENDLSEILNRNPSVRIRSEMRTKTHLSTVAEPSRREARTDKVESTPAKKDYKAELLQQFALVGIQVEPEFYFAKPRKFRSDWRVKGLPVLIEYDGGIFSCKASHSSIGGILRDIEKMNMAAIAGYIVIRVTPKHVVSGEALQWVERAVERAKAIIEVVKKARASEDEGY